MSDPQASPPDREPFSRSQVLVSMGITAVVLLGIAKFWMYSQST